MSAARKIRDLLRPAERRGLLVLFGLTTVGMVLEALGIGLVIPAFALLTDANPAGRHPALAALLGRLGNPGQTELAIGGMVVLTGIYIIKTAYLAFLAWSGMRFVYGVQARLSQQLFETYLRQPYAFHLQRNSAQLIRNATKEVEMFAGVLTDMLHLVGEGLVLLAIAALLVFVEPVGTMFVGLVLAAAAFGFHRITHRRVTGWGLTRQRHEGLRIQHLQQGLGGVKDVKLYGRDATFLAEYAEHNLACARVARKQQTLLQMPRLWMELLSVAGLSILVVTLVLQGRDMAAIVPSLALFAAAAFRLMPLFNRALNGMQSLRFGLPVVDVLHAELALPSVAPVSRRAGRRGFERDITLRGVGYTYPSAAGAALSAVDLTIRKNECVGFIGASGAGKSTLVDVILGLLTANEGAVLVDGRDIHEDLRGWQDQIGYVPQTIFLTDDSMRRNVAFGVPADEIDDEAVKKAIEAAQLGDFVASLPSGLETAVGERGVRLSGGQRQRIGIARALYHDPEVVVLDEATSALDTTTERGVMDAVAALQGRKTILIVAHRASTVERCDRLYRLEGGVLVSQGCTADLLRIEAAAS